MCNIEYIENIKKLLAPNNTKPSAGRILTATLCVIIE